MATTIHSEGSTLRRPPSKLEQLVVQHNWLALDADGIVRCPLLVKGELVGPPAVDRASIERAFAPLDAGRTSADPYASYARVGAAQVLRHAELDRTTLRATGRWIYRAMPVIDPLALP